LVSDPPLTETANSSATEREKEYLEYVRNQVAQLDHENDIQWQAALQNLVLAMPISINVLIEAILQKKVRFDRASAFANFISANGFNEETESIFRAIVEQEPENSAHLNNLAVVLLKEGKKEKIDEAITLLDRAVVLDWKSHGAAAADMPAKQNRDLAVPLANLVLKDSSKVEKKAEASEEDAMTILKKEIQKQHNWKALWETLLAISDPVVRYLPTLLFGVITPVGVIALAGKVAALPPEVGSYSISIGLAFVTIFLLIKFLAQRGIHGSDLEIDSRRQQYVSMFEMKLKVQQTAPAK
jgi:tetratricopeptide (TPR) repeat protein